METDQLTSNQDSESARIQPQQAGSNRGLFLVVVISILLTAMITGSAVYFWQKSTSEKAISSLEQKINSLEEQVSIGRNADRTSQPTPALPSPVSSQITGWKNYQSEEIGVYFEYPPNFRIEEDYVKGTGLVDDGIFIDLAQTSGKPSRWMKISRSDKSDFWNYSRLGKVYSLNMGQLYTVPENETIRLRRIEDMQFAGKTWRVFEDNEPYEVPTPIRYLVTLHNNHYYLIFITYSNPNVANPEYPEYGVNFIQIFDQILSTIKFIN